MLPTFPSVWNFLIFDGRIAEHFTYIQVKMSGESRFVPQSERTNRRRYRSTDNTTRIFINFSPHSSLQLEIIVSPGIANRSKRIRITSSPPSRARASVARFARIYISDLSDTFLTVGHDARLFRYAVCLGYIRPYDRRRRDETTTNEGGRSLDVCTRQFQETSRCRYAGTSQTRVKNLTG